MSGFKEHATAGAIVGTIVGLGTAYVTSNMGYGFTFGVAAFTGSIIPDSDTGSIPSRIFAWVTIILSSILMYFGEYKQASVVGIIYAALSCGKHRGWTHGWTFIIACFAAAYLTTKGILPNYYILLGPFAFGLITHKFLDK